jgi:hypothetical protein
VLNNPLSNVDPGGLDLWSGDGYVGNDPNCDSGDVSCGNISGGGGHDSDTENGVSGSQAGNLSFYCDLPGNCGFGQIGAIAEGQYASQQYTSYSFTGGANTVLEQQTEQAAIAYGEQACGGDDPGTVSNCIQQVYNQLESQQDGPNAPWLEGGNYNFPFTGIQINGQAASAYDFGCSSERCNFNGLGSLDYSHNNDAFHVDTADPFFFPIGTFLHVFVDMFLGNIPPWSTGGIPR